MLKRICKVFFHGRERGGKRWFLREMREGLFPLQENALSSLSVPVLEGVSRLYLTVTKADEESRKFKGRDST